jgi:Uma2 family endonuclease
MNIALERIESPVRIVPSQPLSLEDFWQFSADNRDLRLEREPNGDLLVMTPTLGGAGFRSSLIFLSLGKWTEETGTGYALDSSTGFLLPDGSIRSPDAAWISSDRWTPPAADEDSPAPYPDFVIELRSKSDRLAPLQAKMRAWIANGVELGWLIDPKRKVTEIYRPGREPEVLEGGSCVEGDGPVGGFVLELGRIWG